MLCSMLSWIIRNAHIVIRLYFSTIGLTEDYVLLPEELDENVCVNINHAKDYNYVTVNPFSPEFSKRHFADEDKFAIEDVDFSEKYLALELRESETLRKVELLGFDSPLPVGQMPDAVVVYDLSNGTWKIVKQQNLLREKYQVPSHDGVMIPLTIVYSRSHKKEDGNPGLLYGLEAYGEILDKRWRSEPKSLLDRGWIIAFADVRGGGGRGLSWCDDGRWTKKQNSIEDYVSSARFLIDKGIIQENKLAGWGYSAGGLLLASAINKCLDLFYAAVLKVPFLDPTDTLLYPILPLIAADYDEFGYPEDVDDFIAIQEYSSE